MSTYKMTFNYDLSDLNPDESSINVNILEVQDDIAEYFDDNTEKVINEFLDWFDEDERPDITDISYEYNDDIDYSGTFTITSETDLKDPDWVAKQLCDFIAEYCPPIIYANFKGSIVEMDWKPFDGPYERSRQFDYEDSVDIKSFTDINIEKIN